MGLLGSKGSSSSSFVSSFSHAQGSFSSSGVSAFLLLGGFASLFLATRFVNVSRFFSSLRIFSSLSSFMFSFFSFAAYLSIWFCSEAMRLWYWFSRFFSMATSALAPMSFSLVFMFSIFSLNLFNMLLSLQVLI